MFGCLPGLSCGCKTKVHVQPPRPVVSKKFEDSKEKSTIEHFSKEGKQEEIKPVDPASQPGCNAGGDLLDALGQVLGGAITVAAQGIASGLDHLPIPASGNQEKVFQAIFGLGPEDVLVEYFSCALEQDLSILHHGKMYLSSRFLCFHSEVGGSLRVIFPLVDIVLIRESSHWLVNPAISVFVKSDPRASQRVDGCKGKPTSVESNGTEVYQFASFWDRDASLEWLVNTKSTPPVPVVVDEPRKNKQQSDENDSPPDTFQITPKLAPYKSTLLKGQDKDFLIIHEEIMPLSAETFLNRWLVDDSELVPSFHAQLNHRDLQIGKWGECAAPSPISTTERRTITFVAACSHWMCPPETRVEETQTLYRHGTKLLIHEATLKSLDIPYGECFILEVRWKIQAGDQHALNSATRCRAQVSLNVHFVRRCVWESKIKSGAISEMKIVVAKCMEFIHEHMTVL